MLSLVDCALYTCVDFVFVCVCLVFGFGSWVGCKSEALLCGGFIEGYICDIADYF